MACRTYISWHCLHRHTDVKLRYWYLIALWNQRVKIWLYLRHVGAHLKKFMIQSERFWTAGNYCSNNWFNDQNDNVYKGLFVNDKYAWMIHLMFVPFFVRLEHKLKSCTMQFGFKTMPYEILPLHDKLGGALYYKSLVLREIVSALLNLSSTHDTPQ